MTELVVRSTTFPVAMADKVRQNLTSQHRGIAIAPRVTLITKSGGGVGVDGLTSILQWLMNPRNPHVPVFQAGGTKKLIAISQPSDLYSRVMLDNPRIKELFAEFIVTHAAASPVVMIDPSFNAAAIEIVEAIATLQTGIEFFHLHVVRYAQENTNILTGLAQFCKASRLAMIRPYFEDEMPSGCLIIPRLPDQLARAMFADMQPFVVALQSANTGTLLALTRSLKAFRSDLDAFYA